MLPTYCVVCYGNSDVTMNIRGRGGSMAMETREGVKVLCQVRVRVG